MIKNVPIVLFWVITLATQFQIKGTNEEQIQEFIGTNYTPCAIIPYSRSFVNNNSISTAIPNPKNRFYVAVTGKSEPTVMVFPLSPILDIQQTYAILSQNVILNPTNDACSESSATDFSDDGTYLIFGCGSSDSLIFSYKNNSYIFTQTLKNSYNKDGGKIFFSADGRRLFTTQSSKQINIYHQGANLFVPSQIVYVNLQMRTLFTVSRNTKHFATIERNDSAVFLSIHSYSKEDNNSYVRLNHTESINMLVADIFMNDRFIVLVSATSVSGCSTIVYKMSQDSMSFAFEQQIVQSPPNSCVRSGEVTSRNQLILTLPNQKSIIYQYINNNKKFVKQDQIYHQFASPNIFTQVRLIDTEYEHLLIYNNVGYKAYCPKL